MVYKSPVTIDFRIHNDKSDEYCPLKVCSQVAKHDGSFSVSACLVTDEMLFLDVTMKSFQMRLPFESGRLNKSPPPSPNVLATTLPAQRLNKVKVKKEEFSPLHQLI